MVIKELLSEDKEHTETDPGNETKASDILSCECFHKREIDGLGHRVARISGFSPYQGEAERTEYIHKASPYVASSSRMAASK